MSQIGIREEVCLRVTGLLVVGEYQREKYVYRVMFPNLLVVRGHHKLVSEPRFQI
jgi:hypothetical protein